MHPAPSIIVFTVLSGMGFGLLAWFGICPPQAAPFWQFFLAYALAGGGLLSSTLHLGNPQRFLRAFTQWRTSWLSREGCLSVVAMGVMGIYAIGIIFMGQVWVWLGIIGAVLSVLTIFATSMIYAQLKTVPRWNQPTTPVMFLLLGLTGGALLAGQTVWPWLILTGVTQIIDWMMGDGRFTSAGSTQGTATGLGNRGKVRAFEAPHTGNNYLLREMVYEIGRKHVMKLRVIAFTLMIIVPVMLLVLHGGMIILGIATLIHLIGAFTQRWLFFAQAEHVVGLYYGKR